MEKTIRRRKQGVSWLGSIMGISPEKVKREKERERKTYRRVHRWY